jgi:hypothetical protein
VGGALVTTGGVLGSAGTVVLFGAGGAGLAGWKTTKRWGDLTEFYFRLPTSAGGEKEDSLELVIAVSGWLRDEQDDFGQHWSALPEAAILCWESENLRKLGSILYRLIRDEIAKSLTSFYLTAAFGAAVTPLMWPVWVLNSLGDLDNAWLVCKDKALIAGEELAEAILSSNTTGRPVKLVGFSMGAVVVFEALLELANRSCYDKISEVVLIGTPISTTFSLFDTQKRWARARSVVAGRFVNCHSRKDWLLQVLARYLDWGIHIAGLEPLASRETLRIQDIDVADLVTVHTEYPAKIPAILHRVSTAPSL